MIFLYNKKKVPGWSLGSIRGPGSSMGSIRVPFSEPMLLKYRACAQNHASRYLPNGVRYLPGGPVICPAKWRINCSSGPPFHTRRGSG